MERIRSLIVRKPDLSILEVQQLLKDNKTHPLPLHKDYINKLLHKIRNERINRMNNRTVNFVLAEYEDEIISQKEKLWTILNDPNTTPSVKVSAIHEMREATKTIIEKMFDAGVFERQLGSLKAFAVQLNPDDEELIKKAIAHAQPTLPAGNTENSQ